MGVIQSTSDQTIRRPEIPSSRRVSTIASEIKQTKLTLKLLVFIFIGAQGVMNLETQILLHSRGHCTIKTS